MAECLCLNHALPEPPNLCVEGLTPSVSFFYYYLLGYNCFTVPCQFLLYNRVNQLYIHVYPFSLGSRSPPPIPPLQVTTEHRVELPVLYSRFPLSIYFTHGGVYMSVLISQFIPFLCPHVHMSVPYSCPGNRFISTIFLDSTCKH